MAWNYSREETRFELLPEGKYRVRIKSAEKAVSSKGNDMLILQLEVSGSTRVLFHYIVFLTDRPEITNRMLTQFFDSFKDIPEGDFDMSHWIGKVGAVKIKHEEYNDDMREKINYFISADKQDDLPPWKNPDGSIPNKDGWFEIPAGSDAEDDLPF